VIFAFRTFSPKSILHISPIRIAPAVWEEEGPTVMGPKTSNKLIAMDYVSLILISRQIIQYDILLCNKKTVKIQKIKNTAQKRNIVFVQYV
jgi:hypothetical protein